MRIFISHSWKDKTAADILVRDIEPMCEEVWYDIQQLKPGDVIQATIDEAIGQMDIVLLLWSEHAAHSENVLAEVDTALRLGVQVLALRHDDTPLGGSLQSALHIDFRDYTNGFGRLSVMLLRHLSGTLGVEMDEELDAIKDLEGTLDYLQNYRSRNDIQDMGRGHWIERAIEANTRMHDRVTKMQDRLSSTYDYVQEIYGRLEDAGKDRQEVEAILADVTNNEHRDPELISQVRVVVERFLSTLPKPEAQHRLSMRTVDFHNPLAQAPKSAGQPRAQIRAGLQPLVDASMLEDLTEGIQYYLASAQLVLETLYSLAKQRQSQGGMYVVQQLNTYLQTPSDLFPESQYGAWGLIDDAWLIHNTAYRLIESGILPADSFAVDWNRIATADNVVVRCLPLPVMNKLEAHLMQFMNTIAHEVNSYSPHFSYGPQGYHPHMTPASSKRDELLRLRVENAIDSAYLSANWQSD